MRLGCISRDYIACPHWTELCSYIIANVIAFLTLLFYSYVLRKISFKRNALRFSKLYIIGHIVRLIFLFFFLASFWWLWVIAKEATKNKISVMKKKDCVELCFLVALSTGINPTYPPSIRIFDQIKQLFPRLDFFS